MYYLIISIIVLCALMFLENKRIKFASKFGEENTFFKALKNNFKFINFICLPLMFLSIFMILYILLRKNGYVGDNYQVFKLSHVSYILYSVFTIPIVEEYFYRFFPYSIKKFNNIFMYVIIIFISSLIFTYAHQVGVYESIVIFLIALTLSVIYLLTKNISYTIICHSLYNLLVLIYTYINIGYIYCYLVIFGISFIIFIINSKIKVKL